MRRGVVFFVAICLAGAALARDRKAPIEQPTQFEIGLLTFFDFGPPMEYYELFVVRPAEDGTRVQRVTLTPPGIACVAPASYEMAEATLEESVVQLMGKTNPCNIPEKELRREEKRCKKCMVFSGQKVLMHVACGNQTRLIRADILDRDMFDPAANTPEYTSWTRELIEKLTQPLPAGVIYRHKPFFTNDVKMPDDVPDSHVLKDLDGGRFDALFPAGDEKPSELYRRALNRILPPTIKLVRSTPIAPEEFPTLEYPPLARMAHMEGTVVVDIEVDTSGRDVGIEYRSGIPMLSAAVQNSAGRWKFPSGEDARHVEVTIQFSHNCPREEIQKVATR
jgi:TonB family protein